MYILLYVLVYSYCCFYMYIYIIFVSCDQSPWHGDHIFVSPVTKIHEMGNTFLSPVTEVHDIGNTFLSLMWPKSVTWGNTFLSLLWPKSVTWGSHFCLSCDQSLWLGGSHFCLSCNWSPWHEIRTHFCFSWPKSEMEDHIHCLDKDQNMRIIFFICIVKFGCYFCYWCKAYYLDMKPSLIYERIFMNLGMQLLHGENIIPG